MRFIVLRQKRFTEARISLADLTHLYGFGSSLCASMKAIMSASNSATDRCTSRCCYIYVDTRTADVHIARLRKALKVHG